MKANRLLRACLILYFFVAAARSSDTSRRVGAAKRPHVILFVIDDLGWNDVSYQGAEFKTPNIDKLANSGVKLDQYYVNRICSPTRSSIMAGRYAYNMGLDGPVIGNGHAYGLPLNHTTIGDAFKTGGYSTHAIGKWDLGMYNWESTPTYRGFDTFLGFYNAAEEYFTHTCSIAYHFPGTNTSRLRALDFRRNKAPEWSLNGTYSTNAYSQEAVDLIKAHDKSEPFFMYLAYQAVHGPLEAPQHYIDMCSDIAEPRRQVYCGMAKALDEGIGNITQALVEAGMWDDTLIAFTTDNGGQIASGGNNWPLRGNKATVWEGGVRGVAFVTGAGIEHPSTTYNGLMHASDWLLTLAEGVAGLNVTVKQQLDGMNIWPAILSNTTSPRHEILLSLMPARYPTPDKPHARIFPGTAAIRVDQWKLIIGMPNCSLTPHPSTNMSDDMCPSGWVHPSAIEIPPPANPSLVWLFDMDDDPLEKNDVHEQHPDIVEKLRQRIEAFNATHINQMPPPVDPASNPNNFGGVWTPWITNGER
ncbi:arylsulfatase B-like [Sycon ciliatum]|uniref:arylsulfatase B-like n=1 Tax=Sycon ciliatum TaxID=27933 RepID=UPI0031F6FDE9